MEFPYTIAMLSLSNSIPILLTINFYWTNLAPNVAPPLDKVR